MPAVLPPMQRLLYPGGRGLTEANWEALRAEQREIKELASRGIELWRRKSHIKRICDHVWIYRSNDLEKADSVMELSRRREPWQGSLWQKIATRYKRLNIGKRMKMQCSASKSRKGTQKSTNIG